MQLMYINFLKLLYTLDFSLLFFVFALYKVFIINSVIFLFELGLKQFKISKILTMWKIVVY